MGTLCRYVLIGQRLGEKPGPIVSYCTSPIRCTSPGPLKRYEFLNNPLHSLSFSYYKCNKNQSFYSCDKHSLFCASLLRYCKYHLQQGDKYFLSCILTASVSVSNLRFSFGTLFVTKLSVSQKLGTLFVTKLVSWDLSIKFARNLGWKTLFVTYLALPRTLASSKPSNRTTGTLLI